MSTSRASTPHRGSRPGSRDRDNNTERVDVEVHTASPRTSRQSRRSPLRSTLRNPNQSISRRRSMSRQHSNQSSRQSSISRHSPHSRRSMSEVSAISSAETGRSDFGDDPDGLETLFRPLGAASRVALKPHRYNNDQRKRAAHHVRRAVSRYAIDEAIAREEQRIAKRMLEPMYATKQETLSKNIYSWTGVTPTVYSEVRKNLKREFPQRFTQKTNLLNSFIDSFLEAVNEHQLSTKQATSLLTSFFSDVLKATVTQRIELQGLADIFRTLDATRATFSPRTVFKQRSPPGNWTRARTYKSKWWIS